MTAADIELLSRISPWVVAAALVAGAATSLFAAATYRRARVIEERRDPWGRRAAEAGGAVARMAADVLAPALPGIEPSRALGAWLACSLLPPLAAVALGLGPVAAVILLLAGSLAPWAWARLCARRARERFDEVLSQALPLVAANLRGGLSFRVALVPVGRAMPEPLSGEFARLGDDLDAGEPLEGALSAMSERCRSRDVALLASAVMAQRETGGNLADVVDSVALAVRDRVELRQLVRSRTSQARASATVLVSLPPLILCVMCAISESYREFYLSPGGLVALAAVLALALAGYAIMRRMAAMRAD